MRLLTEVPNHEELVNSQNSEYRTALHFACCMGSIDIAKILLDKGGKKTIDAQDENGQTALFLAIMTGNLDLIKLLLKNGASTSIKDSYGKDAVTFAKEKCQVQVWNYLTSL